MEPFRYVDDDGRAWDVVDFRVIDRRKRTVPFCHRSAEGRAFVPVNRDGPVLLYTFGLVSYHSAERKCLEDQLRFAKAPYASAAERMTRE